MSSTGCSFAARYTPSSCSCVSSVTRGLYPAPTGATGSPPAKLAKVEADTPRSLRAGGTWEALTVRRLAFAGVVLVVLGAAGCSSGTSSPPTTTLGVNPNSHLTAVEEATSWFKAINAKNREASLAHYEADTRYNIGDWNNGDVSHWATFTNVREQHHNDRNGSLHVQVTR
jgi:hypothetical protein